VTANNFIRSLEKIGILELEENSRKYRLGTRILGMGTVVASNLELNQKGAELAVGLSSRTGFMCRLGVWDKDAVLGTFRAIPGIRLSLGNQFGPRVLAYCSAMGRAILAHFDRAKLDEYFNSIELLPITPKTKTSVTEITDELEQTRIRGYSISNEEIVLGSINFGAPIFKKKKEIAGSISIYCESDILKDKEVERVVKELKNTASLISQNMGFGPGFA
jgi:DNA-binding IclR family transcriptional regulator